MIDAVSVIRLAYGYIVPRVPMLAMLIPFDLFVSVFTAVQQALSKKVIIDVNFTEWGSIASVAKEFLDIVRDPTPPQRAELIYILLGFLTNIESYMDMPTFVRLVMEKLEPKEEAST